MYMEHQSSSNYGQTCAHVHERWARAAATTGGVRAASAERGALGRGTATRALYHLNVVFIFGAKVASVVLRNESAGGDAVGLSLSSSSVNGRFKIVVYKIVCLASLGIHVH